MPDPSQPASLEIAHVLFTDMIAYSRLPTDRQQRMLSEFQEAVWNTSDFRRARNTGKLISLPTGDGIALVFFEDPEAPARCAIELGRALRGHAEIRLRMGIHSGPVYRIADINENRNVAGGGINVAQRVMDSGDEGHILVSAEAAKVLGQISTWEEKLVDLGEVEVKHGVRVHVFNLCTENAGNPVVPQKLCRRAWWDRKAQGRPSQSASGLLLVTSVLFLVVLGIGIIVGKNFKEGKWRLWGGGPKGANSTGVPFRPRRSVAVLDFKNISSDPRGTGAQDAWLGTAFPEWLTTELATGNELRLVSGEDVARMTRDLSLGDTDSYSKDTLARMREVLHADYIVVGKYFTSTADGQESVRVDLRVQDTHNGEVLGMLSDTGSASDITSIASRTGQKLRRTLGSDDPQTTEAKMAQGLLPSKPQAAKLYAEGLERMRGYEYTGARDALVQATALEPTFALAHLALSTVWSALGYGIKSREEAQRAFELSTQLPPKDRLYIEARYRESSNEYGKAVEIYRSLWTLYPDDLGYGLRFANAQEVSGKPKDALATLQTLLKTVPGATNNPSVELAEAHAAGALGDLKGSQEASARAVTAGEALGERQLLARALLSEGHALGELGKPDDAFARFTRARQIATEVGDFGQVATSLTEMGMDRAARGNKTEATKLFQEALAIDQEIGFLRNEAWPLSEMAILLRHSGRLKEARIQIEKVIAIRREISDKRGLAQALGNLANILDDSGDTEGAVAKYKESLAIDRESGNRRGQAITLGNLGNMLYKRGRVAEGRKDLEEAVRVAREIGFKGYCVWALGALGDVKLAQDDFAGAQKDHEEALNLAKELAQKSDVAMLQEGLAQIAIEEGYPDRAEKPLRDAIAEFHSENDPDSEARCHGYLAQALAGLKREKEADEEMALATRLVASSQNSRVLMAVATSTASVLLTSGRVAEAKQRIRVGMALAAKDGNLLYEFDLRKLRCDAQGTPEPTPDSLACLKTLEKDALAAGFLQVARKAHTAASQPH